MGKMQRVYKTGTDFWVEGASERGRCSVSSAAQKSAVAST
jgi:hypothetical protein